MKHMSAASILLSLATTATVVLGFTLPQIISQATDAGLLHQHLTMHDDTATLVLEEVTANDDAATAPLERLKHFNDIYSGAMSSIQLENGTRMTETEAAEVAVQAVSYFGVDATPSSVTCEAQLMTMDDDPSVFGIYWDCAISDTTNRVYIDDQSGIPVGFTLVVPFKAFAGQNNALLVGEVQAIFEETYGFSPEDTSGERPPYKTEDTARENSLVEDSATHEKDILSKCDSAIQTSAMERILAFCSECYPSISGGVYGIDDTTSIVTLTSQDSAEGVAHLPLTASSFDIAYVLCEFNLLSLNEIATYANDADLINEKTVIQEEANSSENDAVSMPNG